MEEKSEKIMETKGMGWRVSLSILGGVGWLVFLLLWFFFYAGMYNWEKNVAIFLLSLLVLVMMAGTPLDHMEKKIPDRRRKRNVENKRIQMESLGLRSCCICRIYLSYLLVLVSC